MRMNRCYTCGRFSKRNLCPRHQRVFLRKLGFIKEELAVRFMTRGMSVEQLKLVLRQLQDRHIVDAQDRIRRLYGGEKKVARHKA
jgi:hypothetical protein